VVAALGCSATPPLRFQPTPEEEQWAAAAVPPGTWVALHPAGGANPGGRLLGKRWPRDRFGELAQRLLRRELSIMLLGGPDDYEATQEIAAKLGPAQRQRVYDFAGRSSFGQTAALLGRCALFVGNDTGSMHLAAAMGIPVVAIFGPSRPELYGPVAQRRVIVHHGDRCGSCRFEGGIAQHCVNNFACIAAVSVDEVERAAAGLLPPV
jgi:ADP-heptose:LPS heptosyltransferase